MSGTHNSSRVWKKSLVKEGFWASSQDPKEDEYKGQYPWPREEKISLQQQTELLCQIAYIETYKAKKRTYKGWSWCRLCELETNGDSEYAYKGFMWPQGLSHYIAKHNVLPSDAFMDMMKKRTQKVQLEKDPKAVRRSYFKHPEIFLERVKYLQENEAKKTRQKNYPPCEICGIKVDGTLYFYNDRMWVGNMMHLIEHHQKYPDRALYKLVMKHGVARPQHKTSSRYEQPNCTIN